jgi:hypothetical protein
MKIARSRIAASLAAIAVLSISATPAFAHGRGAWHGHHRHGRGGIDGGDLLAGLLVIGGIAVIADAASKANDRRSDDRADYPGGPDGDFPSEGDYAGERDGPDFGQGDYSGGPGAVAGSQQGFDGAVDACSVELDRSDRRISSVDNVRRMGGRYSVEGRLDDGRGYACSVDDTGQIRSVAVDGRALI